MPRLSYLFGAQNPRTDNSITALSLPSAGLAGETDPMTTALKRHNVTGAILAGGRSTRFGEKKASFFFKGVSLIEHVYRALDPLVDELLISTGRDPDGVLEIPGRTIADDYENAGPLAGVAACLRAASHDWLLVVACDLPLITTQTLARLVSAARFPRQVVILRSASGRTQPLCACYHGSVLEPLVKALDGERFGVQRFVESLEHTGVVEAPDTELLNVNRPEDIYPLLSNEGRDHEPDVAPGDGGALTE